MRKPPPIPSPPPDPTSPPPYVLTTPYSSVYSSYEHSASHTSPAALAANPSLAQLPTDIVIELLFAVALLCIGIVLASPDLRPIQWSVWAEQIERDDRRPKDRRAYKEDGQLVVNPYRWLEERRGFVDVRVSCFLIAGSPHGIYRIERQRDVTNTSGRHNAKNSQTGYGMVLGLRSEAVASWTRSIACSATLYKSGRDPYTTQRYPY